MLGVGLDGPDAREEAELHRPFVVQGVDHARLDHRRPPSGKTGVGRGARYRGEILQHQHNAGREFEPDGEVPMPFVRRAGGAQPVADLGVDKAGGGPDRKVGSGEEPRFAGAAGVPRLRGLRRIVRAGRILSLTTLASACWSATGRISHIHWAEPTLTQ